MRIMWDGCGIILHPDTAGVGEDEHVIAEEWDTLKAVYAMLVKVGTIHIGKEILTRNPKNNCASSIGNLKDQDTVV